MMDNLGVAMNATTLQAYALEKGVNFNWNTASNAQKAELAMKMFAERTQKYAGNFAKEAKTTFSGSLGALKASFQDLLANMFGGGDVKASLTKFVASVGDFLSGGLAKMFANVGGAIATIVPALLFGLADGFPLFLEGINNLALAIPGTFAETLPNIANSALEIIIALVNSFISNVPLLLECIYNISAVIFRAFLATDWVGLGLDVISLIADGVVTLFLKIPNIMLEIATKVIDVFANTDWIAVGKNIITGIANGIARAVTGLVNIAINACKKLVDGVKSFFGIHSPSKLMANEIGRFIPAGIALGISNNMGSVVGAMDEVNDLVLSGANSEIAYRAVISGNKNSREMTQATNKTVLNQTINNYSPKALSPSETARLNRNEVRQLLLSMEVN